MNDKILVLGNGPSLKKHYFPLFKDTDTLGMNAAYRYWRQIDWYPTYYSCLDDQVVVSHADAIAQMVREKRSRRFFLHQDILRVHPELVEYPSVDFLCQLNYGAKNEAACQALGLDFHPHPFFQSSNHSKLTTGS